MAAARRIPTFAPLTFRDWFMKRPRYPREERARVIQCHRVQIGHGANGNVVIRVALGIGQRGQPLERSAVGHVVITLPALVLHHVPLILQRLLVERRQQ